MTVAPVPRSTRPVASSDPSLTTRRSQSGRCARTRSTTARMVAASLYAGIATSVRWRVAVDMSHGAPPIAGAKRVLHKRSGRPIVNSRRGQSLRHGRRAVTRSAPDGRTRVKAYTPIRIIHRPMWAKRSLQCSRAPHVGWLLLVLLAAAAPRFLWYRTHHPWLPPDSYGYLNVAREWRGEPVPLGVWDDRSQLPADNQAARTPGYPLFLNLVFALTGHAPTPDASLADARRVLIPDVGTGARAVHLRHLNTDENVRAVQAVQHGVGVVAAGLAFLIAYRWTSRASAAAVAAIVGVAWHQVLIVTLEPQVMAETLAGTLLIAIIWLLTRQTRTSDGLAAALCGVSVVVRPAMLFAALPILVYLLWNNRRHLFDATVLLALPLLLLTLLAANNGLRYGYWGISSIGGATLLTHAAAHADALDEPARSIAAPFRPYFPSGFVVVQRVASLRGTSYFEAVRIVNAIAVQYVLRHPR